MKHREMVAMMGKLVVVTQRLVRERSDDDRMLGRTWVPVSLPTPRTGWVVGFKWLQNGQIDPGYPGFNGIDGYEPPEPTEFKETGPRTPAMMVCFWPTMKPDFVPMDGYRMAVPGEAPTSPAEQCPWDERAREVYRKIAAELPRDAMGRFRGTAP